MADEHERFLTVSGGTVVRLADTIGLVFDMPGGDQLKLVLPRDGVNPFVDALEAVLTELVRGGGSGWRVGLRPKDVN